ncbi:MAG: hypothetical protein JST54_09495 [Deltaproteobacteria bacterium]|nr:hypothetical protein [Deltaproteobacteria bacterium]
MCSRVTCRTCGKPTWAGCGRHIEQALAGVPKEKRCTCNEAAPSAGEPAKKRWPFG